MNSIENTFLWKMAITILRLILILTSASAVLFIVISVFMRYILRSSLFGVEEIILLAAMWLYFIGGVYGSYKNNHITAEVLPTYIKSQRVKKILRIFVRAFCLAISIVFAVWGTIYIKWCFKVGGATVGLHIPLIYLRFPLYISFILMCLFNIYHLINAIMDREVPGGDAV